MEVDRVSQMGGVDHEQTPAWTRNKLRRRKFTEDAEPAESDQQEEEAQVEAAAESSTPAEDGEPRTLDLMA